MWKWIIKKAAKEAALLTAGTAVLVGWFIIYAIPIIFTMICISIVVVSML